MDMVKRPLQMEMNIEATSQRAGKVPTVPCSSATVTSTKVNSRTMHSTEAVGLRILKREWATKELGETIRCTEAVCIRGKMAEDTKVTTSMIKSTVSEPICGLMGVSTTACGRMVLSMEKVPSSIRTCRWRRLFMKMEESRPNLRYAIGRSKKLHNMFKICTKKEKNC